MKVHIFSHARLLPLPIPVAILFSAAEGFYSERLLQGVIADLWTIRSNLQRRGEAYGGKAMYIISQWIRQFHVVGPKLSKISEDHGDYELIAGESNFDFI